MEVDQAKVMRVLYLNHKGEVGWRLVVPLPEAPAFGSPYHKDEWVFKVWDVDKQAERSYAFSGIIWSGPVAATPPRHFTLVYGMPPKPARAAAPA